MKSLTKKIGAIALAGCMAVGMIGCGDEGKGDGIVKFYDNEENPLLLSTTEVDGVFNPFFSSSATDSNVVGMTQLGMMTSDEAGNLHYGADADALVLDYQSVLDKGANGDNIDYDNDTRTTTFYFVLKNNVKFSNGTPVTMKDVLFNLYVYLDMAYTGSSTIYSTDIVGLDEYRTQADSDTEQDAFMDKYKNRAEARIESLISAWESIGYNRYDPNKKPDEEYDVDKMEAKLAEIAAGGNVAYKNIVKDFQSVKELFAENLEDDWSASLNAYSDMVFKDEAGKEYKNLFTTDVEVFLYNEGKIQWDRKNGRLTSSYTTLGNEASLKTWTKEQAITRVYLEYMPNGLGEVALYWATANKLFEQLTNEELEADSENIEKNYDNISGIKFANGGAERGGASSVTVNNITYETPTYNDDGSVRTGNEVLSIKINGVDPKAKWNFAFTVAPMYYYSSPALIEKFDYVKNFGVQWNSQSFMTKVVKNPDKIGVPVGAGPYMAAKQSGGTDGVTSSDFRTSGIIYYERNPYYVNVANHKPKIKKVRFVVVASNQMTTDLYSGRVDYSEPNAKPETENEINAKNGFTSKSAKTNGYGYIGINAGKLPYLNVRRAIMYSINTKDCIDYYKSTADPIYRSMSTASQYYPKDAIAYYPYIGGKIPSNLDVVDPAYKKFVNDKKKKAGETFTKAQQKEFIKLLMENPYSLDPESYDNNNKYSFQLRNGVYEKSGSATHWARYTFTIAGEVSDHPAWQALFNASNFLNECGFETSVKTDANALQKLASGALSVWAAAWSSTIDPDMYQVYHKDSKASSVQNWGYPSILRNAGGRYDKEVKILDALSEYIEAGRQYESSNASEEVSLRKPFYDAALDEVMRLAVELPTYQRKDLFAFNEKKIDKNSLSNPTAYRGPTSELYNVSLIVKNDTEIA